MELCVSAEGAPFYTMALIRITEGSRSSSFQPEENRAFHLHEKNTPLPQISVD